MSAESSTPAVSNSPRSAPARLATLLIALLGLVALAGCFSGRKPGEITGDEPDPTWIRKEITCRSERILDEVTRLALSKQGYPGARGLEQDLSITTLWQNHLGTRKGEGYRQQAVLRYKPLGKDVYELEVRVRRQINQSIAKPTDLSYAEWEWSDDDERAAQILAQLIQSYFAGEAR
ncbi:MAG: hypothetical protein FJ299_09665 [Planctomycetes bacterium]|nr:hypothetical protein [Planctomycetota bacterium]